MVWKDHRQFLVQLDRAWYGMEWKMEWNGAKISVWNMEDARMEWNKWFQEWNGRQFSILPYQFHTRFRALYLQKNIYGCRVVVNNEVFNFNIYAYYLSTDCGTLVVYITQTLYLLHYSKYIAICSIDVIVDDFDRFDLFFFILRLTICLVVNLFFFRRHENLYLLFHSRFSLILFIVLIFKLILIVFGVKAWYFYYGKCSLAVWLCQIL